MVFGRRQELTFVRADANSDGGINLSDSVFIFRYLFLGEDRPVCLDAADVDDSRNVTLTDGIYLLNHLFRAGPVPTEPFPMCGTDPTPDDLSCEFFPRCE